MQTQEKLLECLKLCVSAIEKEAPILNTYQSTIAYLRDASKLLDGKGLNGITTRHGHWNNGICAHTQQGENHWFSLELAVPQKISRVQITPRLDCLPGCEARAQNIRITNGPSKSYDPNEKLCLPEIPQH